MKIIVACTIALLMLGCRPDDQKTSTIDAKGARDSRAQLPPQLVVHLDSGNAAYRRKDYPAAKHHYEAAIRVDEKHPAAWFGLHMVERAQGNAAAAQRALEQTQKLVPGATLIHPDSV